MHQILKQNYPAGGLVQSTLDTHEFVASFNRWPEEKKEQIQLLQGHFPFGIHQQLQITPKLFTILRDPVERVISYFNHARTQPSHYMYEEIHQNNWSLADLLARGSGLMLNDGQVRQLSGVWGEVGFGEVTSEMLQTAVSNLSQCTIVGLTEQFDATLMLLRHHFSWQNILYTRANIGQNRPKASTLPAETIALIRQFNQRDQQLYETAVQLFQQQCRTVPNFRLQLDWFRLRQRLYHRRLQNNGRLF